MIQWKKSDSKNAPQDQEIYLITDGLEVFLGYYMPNFGWLSFYGEDGIGPITHYASINLPGEVDHE